LQTPLSLGLAQKKTIPGSDSGSQSIWVKVKPIKEIKKNFIPSLRIKNAKNCDGGHEDESNVKSNDQNISYYLFKP